MLELVDLTRTLDREDYDKVFPDLKIRLGDCQRKALDAGVPVVVVIEGWDAAGKGTMINRLTQALDPRGFTVHPISAPSEEERLRPWLWRFWSALPRAGRFAIFDRSWYGRVLVERLSGSVGKRQVPQAYDDIRVFERQLADAGVVLIKLWLHIDRKTQRKRFRRIEGNPATAWKVGAEEWKQNKRYTRWSEAVEEMLERTSTAFAPWTLVEAVEARFARVKIFETVARAVEAEVERRRRHPVPPPAPMPRPASTSARRSTILDRLDLGLRLERDVYEKRLDALQQELLELEHELYVARIPAVIVFSGVDAAGKGGSIRRLTNGLDPRGYEVIPIAAPTREELARHYLARFWSRLPKAGHIAIFDRSWYGRVLVERVEGFCTGDAWRRAYREINEFERQVADFGTVIVKCWLQIDKAEQLRRFKARQHTPHKRWKITDEDWRNRRKWPQYKVAIVDMLQKTSTTYAPWTIVEASDKLYARIKVLSTVADALRAACRKT